MKNILISGANGFIAQNFIKHYTSKYNFICLSHKPTEKHITMPELANNAQLVKSIDIVINLAGANIGDKRWTNKRKHEIITSRINTTKNLVDIFNKHNQTVHFISASAVGIYDNHSSNDESTTIDYNNYHNFSQQITKQWEKTALEYLGTLSIVRFGVVLAYNQGAFKRILMPFLLGIGGKIGNGQQQFSWVSVIDAITSIDFLIEHSLSGVYNIVAPKQITNQELTQSISKIWQKPCFVVVPAWLVRLMFGQMGEELLLSGSSVHPTNLINNGFNFNYPDINSCLDYIRRLSLK